MAVIRQVKAFRGRIRSHMEVATDNLNRMLTYQANHAALTPPLLSAANITLLGNTVAQLIILLNTTKSA